MKHLDLFAGAAPLASTTLAALFLGTGGTLKLVSRVPAEACSDVRRGSQLN